MYAVSETKTKAAVSVAEMARMVNLSRARFYQLAGTTFPWPRYDIATHRPFFDEALQAVCLEARRRNCGVDGRPILFYSPRSAGPARLPLRRPKKAAAAGGDCHADLVEGLKGLGLAGVTAAQVAEAVKEIYPNGVPVDANGEVLRAVFLHLRRRNSGDNVR